MRENHHFGTGSGGLPADGEKAGKAQDADGQEESGKGKPENRRPASGTSPCGQRDRKAGGQSDGCKQCPALLCECEDSGTGWAQAGTCEADSGTDGGSHQPGTGQSDFRLPRHMGQCIL